jgi:hypothetical protein
LKKLSFQDFIYFTNECARQERREFRDRVALAYQQALWMRMDAAKLPDLKDLIGEDPDVEVAQSKPQSTTEMEDILRTFAARSKGGKGAVTRRKG